MSRKHLNPKVLEQLRSKDTFAEGVRHLMAHLLELCPECREEVEAASNTLDEILVNQVVEETTKAFGSNAPQLNARLETLRKEAERDFRALLKLPQDLRVSRVNRAIKKYRNPLLAERFIEASRAHLPSDPGRALEMADCAFDIALRVEHKEFGEHWVMTCVARAKAYRGNALRAHGELRAAGPLLESALEIFEREGNGDALVNAELLMLFFSLRRNQHRYDQAEELIEQAIYLLEESHQSDEIARALVLKADLLADTERLDEAIAVVKEAALRIDLETDARLYLSTQHNLCHYLLSSERNREALAVLQANAGLYESFSDSWTQLRYTWNLGLATRALESLDDAEAYLQQTQHGFLEAGFAYDAALAGLDLALVYARRGKTQDLRRLASETAPIFRAQEMHREATAALLLFQEAARQEAVTATMVTELIECLHSVRRGPVERPS